MNRTIEIKTPGFMVTLVDGAVSIFSVAQQRAAKLCHGDADLMGPVSNFL